MGIITYLTIGIIMFTITSIRIAIRDKEFRKSHYHEPLWWMVTILCMIFWPAVVLSAIWDIFHEQL